MIEYKIALSLSMPIRPIASYSGQTDKDANVGETDNRVNESEGRIVFGLEACGLS